MSAWEGNPMQLEWIMTCGMSDVDSETIRIRRGEIECLRLRSNCPYFP
jgi:hypothetical protein